MKENNSLLYSHYISTINKKWILFGFALLVISTLFLYGRISLSYSLNGIFSLNSEIVSVENLNETININMKEMCTTKWYKHFNLEFNAFSVNNFEKVIFIMDYIYTNRIKDELYKCIFFRFGTNKKLNSQLLKRIGGRKIYDSSRNTLSLQCQIPVEAVHTNAMTIHFLLAIGNDYTNVVNISICRLYNSSFSFINSQIYSENQTHSELINKKKNNKPYMIGACTQTSHHDLTFPLWINYHYKMGIDHFYIYDHAPSNQTRLHKNLKSYIDLNIITIIPWYIDQWNGFKHHSSSIDWVVQQVWSQNDCIHRYGYLYSWLLISDVDEFVVPMGKFKNFQEMLDAVPPNNCALQVLNYTFKGLQNNISIPEQDRPKKYIHREIKHKKRNAHSKNFVRPQLIYYFAVHQVTKSVNGAPVFYADVKTHARLQHYRADLIPLNELSNYAVDTYIFTFLNQINDSLSSIIPN